MRTIAKISGIFRDKVGDEVFRDLVRVYPPGDWRPQHHVFDCELPQDDQRTAQIMDRLARAGFLPWTDTNRPKDDHREYWLELEREYDAAELAQAAYLTLEALDDAGYYEVDDRASDGGILLPDFPKHLDGFDFLSGRDYWLITPARVKAVLESGRLLGVEFRPAHYVPSDARADDTLESLRARHGQPFWELDSSRRMPPLAASMVLLDSKGNRVPRGHPGPCTPKREGLYVDSELHYSAADLASAAPFDLARTFERFSQFGAPADRPLIASQRFYCFCEDHGLKAKWMPVRIDPD